jgi:hypothetical protein
MIKDLARSRVDLARERADVTITGRAAQQLGPGIRALRTSMSGSGCENRCRLSTSGLFGDGSW